MPKALLLLIVVSFFFHQIKAQELYLSVERIKNEQNVPIHSLVKDVSEEYIISLVLENYRKHVYNALNEDNRILFKELTSVEKAYFNNIPYYIFQLSEWEIFQILNNNYHSFFESLDSTSFYVRHDVRERFINKSEHQFYPYASDKLAPQLPKYVADNKSELYDQIEKSEYSRLKKEFMKVYIEYFLMQNDFCNQAQKAKLIQKAQQFEQNFKDSSYYEYSKHVLSVDYKPSGLAIGGFLNTGVLIPSQELGDILSPSILAGLSAEIYFKRLIFSFGFGGSFRQKLKTSFEKDATWLKGDITGQSMGNIGLSYNILESKKINIAPVIGIKEIGIFPPDKDRYDDVDNIKSSNPMFYGINLDLKWGYVKCGKYPLLGKKANSKKQYGIIRVGFTYQKPNFQQLFATGSQYEIKLALGIYEHMAHKIK